MVHKRYRVRKVPWPVPSRTRHREYTVTDKCYLIEAKTPCSGCTLVNVQAPEKGVIINLDVAPTDENRMHMNVNFVIAVAQREVNNGINLLTFMGGEPLTIKGFDDVIAWTRQHPILNGLIYSSSAYYFKPDHTPSRKFYEQEEAGLFSSEFGYFKSSVDMLILGENELLPISHPRRGDTYKAYYGLKLAELATMRGYQVAIHQTLKSYTLKYTIPLYEWAKERGIRFSMCPLVWVPYVSNGKPLAFYADRLRTDDRSQLQEIVDYIIADTVDRFRKGKKRIYVPSSAFTRLMPIFGPSNGLSCRVDRAGRQPNGQDIHPNGQQRWCIAQNTYKDGMRCKGCFYIGIDRNGDFWNFENRAHLKPDDIRWLNADVWMKDPDYDPTGKNLFFNAEGIPL